MTSLDSVANLFTHRKLIEPTKLRLYTKCSFIVLYVHIQSTQDLIANVKIVLRSSTLDHGVFTSASNLRA